MFSQLVTLYLTPVFYTYMAALQTSLGRHRTRSTVMRQPAPVATGDGPDTSFLHCTHRDVPHRAIRVNPFRRLLDTRSPPELTRDRIVVPPGPLNQEGIIGPIAKRSYRRHVMRTARLVCFV